MPGLVATVAGTCSGEGVCVAANMHDTTACSLPPCPPVNPLIKILPLAKMVSTCYWPPAPLIHLGKGTACLTIKVNKMIPLLDKDILTFHISTCTNKVTNLWMTPGPNPTCTNPIIADCLCSLLTLEDTFGKGHPRVVHAKSTTVFFEKRRVAVIGDPLGPPCTALILTGSPNVFVGK